MLLVLGPCEEVVQKRKKWYGKGNWSSVNSYRAKILPNRALPLTKIEATVKFKGPFYSTNFYFVPFGTDEIGECKWASVLFFLDTRTIFIRTVP